MRARIPLLTAILLLLILGAIFSQAAEASITIDPAVRFIPSGIPMVAHFNTTSNIQTIRVTATILLVNGAGLSVNASETVNVTVRTWPASLHGRDRRFVLSMNTTTGTQVSFSMSLEDSSLFYNGWAASVDGVEVAHGGAIPIQFSYSDWQTGVSKTVFIRTDIGRIQELTEEQTWLVTYGPSWLAFLIGVTIIGLIIVSFYRGVKKRKKSGKIWRLMPRNWR